MDSASLLGKPRMMHPLKRYGERERQSQTTISDHSIRRSGRVRSAGLVASQSSATADSRLCVHPRVAADRDGSGFEVVRTRRAGRKTETRDPQPREEARQWISMRFCFRVRPAVGHIDLTAHKSRTQPCAPPRWRVQFDWCGQSSRRPADVRRWPNASAVRERGREREREDFESVAGRRRRRLV